jgi:hypothetical protein
MIAHRFEKRKESRHDLNTADVGSCREDDEDEERLESFQRQRSGMLIEKLLGVLSGVTLAALVLSLVGPITGQSLLRQLFTGPLSGGPDQAPGQTNESFTPAQLPAVTEKPVVADGLTPPTGTSTPPLGTSTPANETGAPATVRPSPSGPAPSDHVASAPSPEAATPKATPPQLVGSHRAELVRGPVSRGWGDSYEVRLLDPAGKPMAGAEVRLVARMADGTVQNIPMGTLPEPGIYRATVPTGRSRLVGLRVRVRTGDTHVEVPVKP